VILAAFFLLGWAAGAALSVLFVVGASRARTPSPFLALDDLGRLVDAA
jgi:hypothetical protein